MTTAEKIAALIAQLRREGPDPRTNQGARQKRLLEILAELGQHVAELGQRVAELESEAAP